VDRKTRPALLKRRLEADRKSVEFSATSTNITELLVVTLAIVSAILLIRKRYDSNVPLLFYVVLIAFYSFTDRSLNPYLLYTGLVMTLLLRFEFMGGGFAKTVAFLSTASLCLIIVSMMADVLT
jgi:hypothetical protein